MNENGLKAGLGIAVAVIASEHFFSTFESSPVTTEKFFKTDEDKAKVWRCFGYAAASSLIFAVVMAIFLENYWSISAALLIIGLYAWVYYEALHGGL
jgi:hypothetical protein